MEEQKPDILRDPAAARILQDCRIPRVEAGHTGPFSDRKTSQLQEDLAQNQQHRGHTGLGRAGIDCSPRESLPSWEVSIQEKVQVGMIIELQCRLQMWSDVCYLHERWARCWMGGKKYAEHGLELIWARLSPRSTVYGHRRRSISPPSRHCRAAPPAQRLTVISILDNLCSTHVRFTTRQAKKLSS